MTQEIASKLAVHAQGGSIHAKDLIDPLQSFADQMILPYNGKSLIHASQKVRSYATQARRGQISPVDQYEMHIFLVHPLLGHSQHSADQNVKDQTGREEEHKHRKHDRHDFHHDAARVILSGRGSQTLL